MERNINTIFVDLGDTLRVIRKDEEYQLAAMNTIADCLGTDTEPRELHRPVTEPRHDEDRN